MASKHKKVIIHTDGACLGNPGKGGYGIILRYGDEYKELAGAFLTTTNNRMELLAVIIGLEALKKSSHEVVIYSDSRYVVHAIEKGWLEKWLTTNFKGKKNVDLWLRYWEVHQVYRPRFYWIKGHAGNVDNERCDQLAVQAAQKGPWARDLGYERIINSVEMDNKKG